jgi:hypothetical protein
MEAGAMSQMTAYAIAMVVTFVINLPFGYWRGGLRKFSPAWFVAIHAPVPLVIGLRFVLGLKFRWAALPFFVAAYFSGQFIGSRRRMRELEGASDDQPQT